MIESIKHRGLRRLYEQGAFMKYPPHPSYDLAQARNRADLLNVHPYEPAHSHTEQPALA
ncbi:MAG: hypothetical protein KJZ86_17590 [Caldilineaceae bacterium]|nr:hypothetical protein [Caldilineaceae bacterium]HRJ44463.1 hypothetical protein [Caldilineaceae bacterium]